MRKHIILFFSALLLFVACKFDNTPKGVVKKDKMTAILADLHLVDGSIYSFNQSPDSLYEKANGRYVALFKKHHTDTAEFNRSLKYYSLHPDKMEDMYTDVLKGLQKKQDSLNAIINKQNLKNALPKK